MILELPLFLHASFDKCIVFEIIALIRKKHLKSRKKLRKKLYIQLMKKRPKLNKKMRKKIGVSINKKPLKLNRKIRKKTNYYCFIGNKKPPKPS